MSDTSKGDEGRLSDKLKRITKSATVYHKQNNKEAKIQTEKYS